MRYLLDANVLREMRPGGHKNVRNWLASVDDAALCISALTIKEIQAGIARKHARAPTQRTLDAQRRLDALLDAYRDRIVPIDRHIAAEWGRLVGTRAKHNDDMALAATHASKSSSSSRETSRIFGAGKSGNFGNGKTAEANVIRLDNIPSIAPMRSNLESYCGAMAQDDSKLRALHDIKFPRGTRNDAAG